MAQVHDILEVVEIDDRTVDVRILGSKCRHIRVAAELFHSALIPIDQLIFICKMRHSGVVDAITKDYIYRDTGEDFVITERGET